MTAGLVVAGGYSTRFGLAEKALVGVGGEPMLCRIVAALDPVVDEVVIDCRDDQVAPFETALGSTGVPFDPSFAIDDAPDRGPIAGVETGLDEIEDEAVVVVSGDRPGVTAELFATLSERRRVRDADAVVPEHDGFLQPFCGVYRTERLATAVAAALHADDRRLCRIPSALDAHVVPERSLAGILPPAAIASVDSPLDVPPHPVECRDRPPGGWNDPGTAESAVHASD